MAPHPEASSSSAGPPFSAWSLTKRRTDATDKMKRLGPRRAGRVTGKHRRSLREQLRYGDAGSFVLQDVLQTPIDLRRPTLSKQVLNDQTYSAAHTQELTGGRPVTKTMTYGGTIVRSLFLIVITLGFAAVGWQWAARVATTSGLWFFLGYILLIALTFAAVNNPKIAAVAGIVYAALMGTWMGSISRIYETYYQGIVGQALLTTVCVFIACLLLYSLRVVRVTGKFIRILMISISGIVLLYLFGWFVSIFGVRLNFLYNGSTTGIAISVVICIVAAMSLIADFAVVETGVNSGAPAAFEWYAAFGLQTTLVWLYLEILYLLARTRGNG